MDKNYIIYIICGNSNGFKNMDEETFLIATRYKYYEFDESNLIKLEVGRWEYLPVLEAITYKLVGDDITFFDLVQGSAVGNINYRHSFSMAVQKNESTYVLYAVLKHPKHLNEAIESFVNHTNELE